MRHFIWKLILTDELITDYLFAICQMQPDITRDKQEEIHQRMDQNIQLLKKLWRRQ